MPNLDAISFLSPSAIGSAIEVTVASIASPTELNSRAATQGDLILARTIEAGTGTQTLYYADATSDAEALPYIVSSATAGVKFVAVAGRYVNQAVGINGALTLGVPLASTSGGTGVNNAGTITNASNTTITGGGTLALGGFTLTVPATGTAGLLGVANNWTLANAFASTVRVNGGAIGVLGVATASETAPQSITAWDATKHVVVCGLASSGTSSAVVFSYDQASEEGCLICLAPGAAWRSMRYLAGAHTFGLGSSVFTIQDSSGMTFADAYNIIFNTTTGTKIGTATSQKLGLWNATPVVQPASANQAAVAATAATNITPYGFTTAAQADGIVTLLNEIRSALVSIGAIKGSA